MSKEALIAFAVEHGTSIAISTGTGIAGFIGGWFAKHSRIAKLTKKAEGG